MPKSYELLVNSHVLILQYLTEPKIPRADKYDKINSVQSGYIGWVTPSNRMNPLDHRYFLVFFYFILVYSPKSLRICLGWVRFVKVCSSPEASRPFQTNKSALLHGGMILWRTCLVLLHYYPTALRIRIFPSIQNENCTNTSMIF